MFRALSNCSVLMTFLEGGAINMERSFVGEWVRRMSAFGIYMTHRTGSRELEEPLFHKFRQLTDAELSGIEKKCKVDCWITNSDHPSRFQESFRADGQKVPKVAPLPRFAP
jgi:hypothetical protein